MAFAGGNIVSFTLETSSSYIATSTKIFSENTTTTSFSVETSSGSYVNTGDKIFPYSGCDITELFIIEIGTPYTRSQQAVFSDGVVKSFVSALSITDGDDSVILQYGAGVDFIASDNNIYKGTYVTFTPQIFGNTFVTYLWDFGDGFTSTEELPSHQFLSAGIFSVSLTATDADGIVAYKLKKDFIIVVAASCDFSGTPLRGTSPLYVAFTSITSGVPNLISVLWNFGDGTTSTIENPTKNYNKPGVYDVTLQCINDIETVTESKIDYILVSPSNIDPNRSTRSFTLGIDADYLNSVYENIENDYDEYFDNEEDEDIL